MKRFCSVCGNTFDGHNKQYLCENCRGGSLTTISILKKDKEILKEIQDGSMSATLHKIIEHYLEGGE